MRYIIHLTNSANNYLFNVTTFSGKTIFFFSAKSTKYRSKQVRSTIVLETLWEKLIQKLKIHKCKLISIKYTGALEYKKKKMLTKLLEQHFNLISLQFLTPVSFNGCKIRHLRRV